MKRRTEEPKVARVFELEMLKAQTMQQAEPDYWTGYERGLRRAYYGERFGTPEEHSLWLSLVTDDDESRREKGFGYIDGFAVLSESVTSDELRMYLKRHNLTQIKAAEMCKVNPRTVRRWALGEVPMPKGAWELLKINVSAARENGKKGGRPRKNKEEAINEK